MNEPSRKRETENVRSHGEMNERLWKSPEDRARKQEEEWKRQMRNEVRKDREERESKRSIKKKRINSWREKVL